MSETALVLYDATARSVSFLPAANELKRVALESAALIGKVDTEKENEVAFAAQAALATIRREVEKARVEATKPALEEQRRINASAKAFVEEINAEEIRIAGLVGSFQQLQEAKRVAAEKAQRLEVERIERERQAELRRVAEEQAAAERTRQLEAKRIADEAAAKQRALDAEAAELARKVREATTAKEKAAAELLRKQQSERAERERVEAERAALELKRQQELAATQSHAAFDDVQKKFNDAQAAVQEVAPQAPVRAAGQTVTLDWEVQISDIHKLYRFHPNCVKLEPLMREIKMLLNGGATVQGITATRKANSQSRSPVAAKAIDIN